MGNFEFLGGWKGFSDRYMCFSVITANEMIRSAFQIAVYRGARGNAKGKLLESLLAFARCKLAFSKHCEVSLWTPFKNFQKGIDK